MISCELCCVRAYNLRYLGSKLLSYPSQLVSYNEVSASKKYSNLSKGGGGIGVVLLSAPRVAHVVLRACERSRTDVADDQRADVHLSLPVSVHSSLRGTGRVTCFPSPPVKGESLEPLASAGDAE